MKAKGLTSLAERLRIGLTVDGLRIVALKVWRGRFLEEYNVEIGVRYFETVKPVISSKIFVGRSPYYRPWVELFGAVDEVELDGVEVRYFDSELEDCILRLSAEYLEPGERIMVEYYGDNETSMELEVGVPVHLSRLGFKLYGLGFLVLRDMYFPEGYMEGGAKVVGEKPLPGRGGEAVRRILSETRDFFRKSSLPDLPEPYLKMVFERASKIMEAHSR